MGRLTAQNQHSGVLTPVNSQALYRKIYEVVDELPTEDIKNTVIYCVPIEGKENEYDMSLYIDGAWVPVESGAIESDIAIINVNQQQYNPTSFITINTLGEIFELAKTKQVIARFSGMYYASDENEYETTIDWLILSAGRTTNNKLRVIAINPNGKIESRTGVQGLPLTLSWDGTANNYADSLVANKMDFAPVNPTAAQIEDLPNGQLYGDTVNHKGIIKGGQQFYDTVYIDSNYRTVIENTVLPPEGIFNGDFGLKVGDVWMYNPPTDSDDRLFRRSYVLTHVERTGTYGNDRAYTWLPTSYHYFIKSSLPTTEAPENNEYSINGTTEYCYSISKFSVNDKISIYNNGVQETFVITEVLTNQNGNYEYRFVHLMQKDETYTKAETDTLLNTKENSSNKVTSLSASSTDTQYPSAKCVYDMIGDVETLLSQV